VQEAGQRQAIPVQSLIYPHRYDVVARLEFLRFYDAQRSLYRKEFREFLRRAWETDFAFHCLQIRYDKGRLFRWLHPGQARSLFEERIREFTGLLEGIRKDGFDPAFPLGMRVNAGPLVTREGKRIFRTVSLVDGYHRLSVLVYLGYRELPPEFWRIETTGAKRVRDNTGRYLRAGRLTPAAHFQFLRDYYGRPHQRSFAELFQQEYEKVLGRPAAASPVDLRLLELAGVLHADWKAMRTPVPAWFDPYRNWMEQAEAALRAPE
jgi:hypothetical protein